MSGFSHPGAVRLRSAAAGIGRKQTEIADALNVSPKSIGQWFRGEKEPSRTRLQELEQVLELVPGELLALFGYLPDGELTIERDGDQLRIVVTVGSTIPGYLNDTESLFDFELATAAA